MIKKLASCPVCKRDYEKIDAGGADIVHVNCQTCGNFILTRTAAAVLANRNIDPETKLQWSISHLIRKMQVNNAEPSINSDLIEQVIRTAELPSPKEQVDNLIIWIGDNLLKSGGPHQEVKVDPLAVSAIMGAIGFEGQKYITENAVKNNLLHLRMHTRDNVTSTHLMLQFKGWDRYYELKKSVIISKTAFMAMQFNDPLIDKAYEECFKPAAKAAGFELRHVADPSKAGLIDLRIQVEIRRARFVIADLTNENRGVYWESGFAAGLGLPVIYTCKKSYFDKNKSHFDTEHHYTLKWEQDKLDASFNELKTVIRATLPSEAILSD